MRFLLFIITLSSIYGTSFFGYLKQTDMSFCMDECAQYYIETEIDPGFGSIKIQERKSRLGRNPTTGDPIEIAQRKAIVFRPSKDLKKKLNYKSDGEDSNV